jgi:hypothetical protein
MLKWLLLKYPFFDLHIDRKTWVPDFYAIWWDVIWYYILW